MVDLKHIETLTCVRSIARGYTTPEHVHDDHAMLLLPLVSTMTVNDHDGVASRPLEPRFFYFVDSGLPHATKSNQDRQEHMAVYLNSDWQQFTLKEAGLLSELQCRAGIWQLSDTAFDLARIMVREHQAPKNGASSRRLQQVTELLTEECLGLIQHVAPTSFGHPNDHTTLLVMEALEYLRGDLSAPPSLDEIAERLEVSRRHLTRIFRERTGLSMGEFLRNERNREAKRLLSETNWSVQQIATMLGIDNAANFATGFKQKFGKSPSRFRTEQQLGPQTKVI